MALFGNQNKKSIEELENYYSGNQQRTGMAWMMAFLSLILTVSVLGGLFLGGRWAYRTFIDDQNSDVEISDANGTKSTSESSSETSDDTESDTAQTTNEGVVSENAARTETPSTRASAPSTEPESTSSSTPTPRQTSPSATAGAQITRTGSLPNTGSAMWGVIAVATLLTFSTSYLVFNRLQAVKLSRREH